MADVKGRVGRTSGARYSLMGPAVLITIGTVFLIHEWRPDLGMGRLWPLILIVIGIVRILESAGTGGGPGTSETPQGSLPLAPPNAGNPGPSSPGPSSPASPGPGQSGPIA